MLDRHNAEPWERTTLVISEERAAPPCANRRLRARGRSVRDRRIGLRVAEGSEAGLRAGDRGEGVQDVMGRRAQPGRAAPPSPRGRGTNETRFGGALQQNLLKIKDGAISGAGTKELLRLYTKAARHLPTPL